MIGSPSTVKHWDAPQPASRLVKNQRGMGLAIVALLSHAAIVILPGPRRRLVFYNGFHFLKEDFIFKGITIFIW